MANKLLTDHTWDRITELAKNAKVGMVAVAYFGQGASRLLPLKKGSVLILDLSLSAVKSGQTCPAEVSKLIRRGSRFTLARTFMPKSSSWANGQLSAQQMSLIDPRLP